MTRLLKSAQGCRKPIYQSRSAPAGWKSGSPSRGEGSWFLFSGARSVSRGFMSLLLARKAVDTGVLEGSMGA
jgi:hypothetical protein